MKKINANNPVDLLTAQKPKLKKDGTPDRRIYNHGKKGNKGNRHATGKKATNKENMTGLSFVANEREYALIKQFNQILRTNQKAAENIISKLGSIPATRATRDSTRQTRSIRCLSVHKDVLKHAIAVIKDRYLLCYDVIAEYDNKQKPTI
jgi:hypothetical protein